MNSINCFYNTYETLITKALKNNLTEKEIHDEIHRKKFENYLRKGTPIREKELGIIIGSFISFLSKIGVTEHEALFAYNELSQKSKTEDKESNSVEFFSKNGKKIVLLFYRGMDSSELYKANGIISCFTIDTFNKNGKQRSFSWWAENVKEFTKGIREKINMINLLSSKKSLTPNPKL